MWHFPFKAEFDKFNKKRFMWPVVEVTKWLLTANSLKLLCSCTKALAAEQLRWEYFIILHFCVGHGQTKGELEAQTVSVGCLEYTELCSLQNCALQPGAGDFTKASQVTVPRSSALIRRALKAGPTELWSGRHQARKGAGELGCALSVQSVPSSCALMMLLEVPRFFSDTTVSRDCCC